MVKSWKFWMKLANNTILKHSILKQIPHQLLTANMISIDSQRLGGFDILGRVVYE